MKQFQDILVIENINKMVSKYFLCFHDNILIQVKVNKKVEIKKIIYSENVFSSFLNLNFSKNLSNYLRIKNKGVYIFTNRKQSSMNIYYYFEANEFNEYSDYIFYQPHFILSSNGEWCIHVIPNHFILFLMLQDDNDEIKTIFFSIEDNIEKYILDLKSSLINIKNNNGNYNKALQKLKIKKVLENIYGQEKSNLLLSELSNI